MVKREAKVVDQIFLTKKEISCLELLVHNYDYEEIRTFLIISQEELFGIIKSIKRKLKSSYWCQAISEGFETGDFNKENYIDETVRKIALEFSKEIFKILNGENYLKNLRIFSFKDGYLKAFVELFLNYCNGLIDENSSHIEQSVFSKLKTIGWVNSFKKVFQLNIVSGKKALNNSIEAEVSKTVINIILINTGNTTKKEKQSLIVESLLKLYATVTLSHLLSKKV